ncbi:MAG: ABC transporter substrate-binding protein [Bilophila wadsworthia]
MRLRKFFSCCIALLLCLAISAPGFSAPLTKVRTAWMDEFEAFPIWYAKEKGWDKEAGLDLEILYFTSGMAILNALPSGEWQYAAIGAVPAMMGALRYTRMSLPMLMRNSSSTASSSARQPHRQGERVEQGYPEFSAA